MQAVILAAGEGRRLKPLTERRPKVMLPLASKPILEWVIEACVESNIANLVVVVGYQKESVMEYFLDGKSWGANIRYVVQAKQLGTAHALLQAKPLVDQEFLVLPGDNLISKETLTELIEKSLPNSMLVKEHPFPSQYGVVTVEKGRVTNIVEKPPHAESNLISTGIYKFDKQIFKILDSLVNQGINDLPSLIKELIREEEPIDAILTNKPWEDVVYPWDLLKVNEKCITPARLKSGTIEKGVTLKGDVSIGKNTLIRSGSYLVGPIVIGRNCEIGPHACILPSTVIGDEVRIAPFSLIRNSLLMDECKIGSGALVNHSVLGKGVRWGAKVSNLADDCIIEIEGKYKHVNNFGIIVGDDAEIGEGSTLKAGVIVGRNCSIAPLKVIEESIPSKVKVM